MNRGSVQDLLYLLILVFLISMVSIFTAKFVLAGQGAIEDSGIQSNRTAEITEDYKAGLTSLDSSIMFFFIFSAVLAIALAFLIPSHPIFMVFSFMFLVIVIIMAVLFGNLFAAVLETTAMSEIKGHFPLTWFLWKHMTKIAVGTGIGVIIASYISSRGGMT